MQLEFHQLELTYKALRCQDQKRQATLVASLCQHGQQSPVVVVEQAGLPGRYVLIDGYQRVSALQRLGHDTVDAVVLPLDEVMALCLTLRLEGAQQRSPLEQGWLLCDLIERHAVSQDRLAQLLGHSASWISRRLALVRELPQQAHALVKRGRLCPYGAMRHLVPLARAKRSDCQQLVEKLSASTTTLSARQLGRLYVAWRSGDLDERQRIVQQPLLYLRAEQAAAAKPELPPGPERLLRADFNVLLTVLGRICRRLRRDKALAAPLPLIFDHIWRQTQLALDELHHLMEGRINAGP